MLYIEFEFFFCGELPNVRLYFHRRPQLRRGAIFQPSRALCETFTGSLLSWASRSYGGCILSSYKLRFWYLELFSSEGNIGIEIWPVVSIFVRDSDWNVLCEDGNAEGARCKRETNYVTRKRAADLVI